MIPLGIGEAAADGGWLAAVVAVALAIAAVRDRAGGRWKAAYEAADAARKEAVAAHAAALERIAKLEAEVAELRRRPDVASVEEHLAAVFKALTDGHTRLLDAFRAHEMQAALRHASLLELSAARRRRFDDPAGE